MAKSKKKLVKKKEKKTVELDSIELVYLIRSRGRVRKTKVNEAFEELLKRLNSRIMQIVIQFYIPGLSQDDIYQEALSALRYKAIPNFDNAKIGKGPNPFDKFAVLCIRRHLSTVLKQSWQVKRRALNTSISLDQDRNKNSDEQLFLSDIIAITDGNILESLEDKEYYKKLFGNLYKKLSKFEKIVFKLYIQKYSYEEMTDVINRSCKEEVVNVKSIDNALSRIKEKGAMIFKKYGQGESRLSSKDERDLK
tara:strand:- start:14391 stop:15143 length:753 start_codon:yes stop_codon:yes gene_type:complete